jgi:hypothetical protein
MSGNQGDLANQKATCLSCGGNLPLDAAGRLCASCLLSEHHEERGDSELAAVTAVENQGDKIERDTYQLGTCIGRYQLLEKIGEGGMGTIYLAEQREPLIRKVALKVIKLGMDTRRVIARFEAERQALALMDHPNIARVLDAGSTLAGRPYFVMEVVQGVAITRFCDDLNLCIRERLRLFVQVLRGHSTRPSKGGCSSGYQTVQCVGGVSRRSDGAESDRFRNCQGN